MNETTKLMNPNFFLLQPNQPVPIFSLYNINWRYSPINYENNKTNINNINKEYNKLEMKNNENYYINIKPQNNLTCSHNKIGKRHK